MRRSQDLEGPDMLIRHRRGWEIAEAQVTPETVFLDRRRLLKSAAAGSLLLGGAGLLAACDDMPAAQAQEGADPSARLYPVERTERSCVDQPHTDEGVGPTHNNYYTLAPSYDITQAKRAESGTRG